MKTRLAALAMGLAASLSMGVFDAPASVSFSAGLEVRSRADFYEPLTSLGAWVQTGKYGRCWHPARVERGWRPYCDGHWEWTDCGWYWVSDEPWAWACYHYGSWTYDPDYGWVWVPETEWAPAWVTWRESDDYIGWAPCGPRGIVLAPSFFVLVDIHHFHERIRPDTVIVNNTTIVNRTRVINNISRETRNFDGARQRVVINHGPSMDRIQRATGNRFNPRPIREVASQQPVPTTMRRSERQRATQEQPMDRTGRQQPRVYQDERRPAPQRERPPGAVSESRRTPTPAERNRPSSRVAPERAPTPTIPPERALPPTGRDRGYQREAPPAERVAPERSRPPVREAPPERPSGPPSEKEKARGHEKEQEHP